MLVDAAAADADDDALPFSGAEGFAANGLTWRCTRDGGSIPNCRNMMWMWRENPQLKNFFSFPFFLWALKSEEVEGKG
jgi:hypothetical protein